MILYHRKKYKQNPRETFRLFKTPANAFTNNFIFTDNEIWQEADYIIVVKVTSKTYVENLVLREVLYTKQFKYSPVFHPRDRLQKTYDNMTE